MLTQRRPLAVKLVLQEALELEFVGEDGGKHRPFMVHRALLGSVERFFGVLIEHYAGAFPTWLAPVQVKVLPITVAVPSHRSPPATSPATLPLTMLFVMLTVLLKLPMTLPCKLQP